MGRGSANAKVLRWNVCDVLRTSQMTKGLKLVSAGMVVGSGVREVARSCGKKWILF